MSNLNRYPDAEQGVLHTSLSTGLFFPFATLCLGFALLLGLPGLLQGQDQVPEESFASYRKQLSDPDPGTRLISGHKLIEVLSDADIPEGLHKKVRQFLLSVLTSAKSPKPTVLSLLKAIGLQKSRHFTAEVLQLIDHGDKEVMYGAIEALALTRDPQVLTKLAKQFMDEQVPSDKRIKAIMAVGYIRFSQGGTLQSAEYLIEVLKSPQPDVRDAALETLRDLSGYHWGHDYASWSKWWSKNSRKPVDAILRDANARIVQDTLREIQPKDLEQNLRGLLHYRDQKILLILLGNLEQLANRKAVEPLRNLLARDPRSAIRIRTIDVLGSLLGPEDEKAASILVRMLSRKEESLDVKAAVIRAMGKIRDVKNVNFVTPLSALLKHESAHLRSTAAESLGKIGRNSTEVVTRLTALLSDKATNVRRASAKALGEIKAAPAVPSLIGCLGDKDPNVRWCVVTSLHLIGKAESVDPLLARLGVEKEPRIVEAIIEALEKLKALQALPRLADIIKSGPKTRMAAKALKAILALSVSLKALHEAADALLDRGCKAAAAQVLELLVRTHPKEAAHDRARLADLYVDTGQFLSAASLHLEIWKSTKAKVHVEKLPPLIARCPPTRRGYAITLAVKACAALKGTDAESFSGPVWRSALGCFDSVKKPQDRAKLAADALLALSQEKEPVRIAVLTSLAELIRPGEKTAGILAHQFLMALFPAVKVTLGPKAAEAAWSSAREAWIKSFLGQQGSPPVKKGG